MTTNTTNSADGSAGAGERSPWEERKAAADAWEARVIADGRNVTSKEVACFEDGFEAARAAIDKGDTQAGGVARRDAIYRKALAMGDGPDVVGPAWQAEGGKSESFEEAAKICEKWAASIDTGKKRNRVVAAAMQGALTCANEIRAAIEEQK